MNNSKATERTQSSWRRIIANVSGIEPWRMPALIAAFVVAESFFKFGSFTLECVAFLALWRALDLAIERLVPGDV